MIAKERRRKRRSDAGTRLTARDLLLLAWIGEMYAIRFDQLRVLLGRMAKAKTLTTGKLSESATRHAIDRWEAAGLAQYKKILADEPGFIWLTTAGLRAAGLPFRRYVPATDSLGHIYWANQLRLRLTVEQPTWSWRSERWLRAELDQKVKSVKLPDAQLSLPNNQTVAVEIEMKQKQPLKLEEILRDRTLVYHQVWYFCPEKIGRAVKRAQSELDSFYAQKVYVYDLASL